VTVRQQSRTGVLLVLIVSAVGLRADETGDRAARLIEKLGGKVVHSDG